MSTFCYLIAFYHDFFSALQCFTYIRGIIFETHLNISKQVLTFVILGIFLRFLCFLLDDEIFYNLIFTLIYIKLYPFSKYTYLNFVQRFSNFLLLFYLIFYVSSQFVMLFKHQFNESCLNRITQFRNFFSVFNEVYSKFWNDLLLRFSEIFLSL